MGLQITDGVRSLTDRLWQKYSYQKHYYCGSCHNRLSGTKSVCGNVGCGAVGIAPKRSRNRKRISIHTVSIIPQLERCLSRNIDRLIDRHREIHNENDFPLRSDTADFPIYKRDIESAASFEDRFITIVLTINWDGVRFKRLSRCGSSQAWPVYLTLEGLSYSEKQKPENVIFAGVTFIRTTPSESIMAELFSRLKSELRMVARDGIQVSDRNGCWWTCLPALKHAIMDFSALKTLLRSPNWQSEFGCHLCTIQGNRIGRSMNWFVRFPSVFNRRTHESVLEDAAAHRNGLNGLTQMMKLITNERCHVDALHAISEGVTCDLFRDMFQSNGRVPEIRVASEDLRKLHKSIDDTKNYTNASKFVLGIADFSIATASEKDALMLITFPLAAAECLCSDPCGSACILSYWALVRLMAESKELTITSMREIKSLAEAVKNLWSEVSLRMFTLKVHCLIDHAISEDLMEVGSPFHWSSAGFERMHRYLQHKIAQSTTNCEEAIVRSFLIRNDMKVLMEEESIRTANKQFHRLCRKMNEGSDNRFRCKERIGPSCYVPVSSGLKFEDLSAVHQQALIQFNLQHLRLSSRLVLRGKVYCSRMYWKRAKDTAQDVIFGGENRGFPVYGSIIVFAYDCLSGTCFALFEKFVLNDPFENLVGSLLCNEHSARTTAMYAVNAVRRVNKFFFLIAAKNVSYINACEIVSPAICVPTGTTNYCSRL
ncbi:hypothetical protein Aduo_009301 [Ancylostoma duodenale]